MNTDDLATLRREFDETGEDSFMFKLRLNLEWDREAFTRLIEAMERCAAAHEDHEQLDRWIAEGFWYLSWFVPDWSGHPNFPKPEDTYHQAACERLRDLAYWMFVGESPCQGNGPLPPL